MGQDIYSMFRGILYGKLEDENVFDVVPVGYSGFVWDHPEYKKVERAICDVLGGTEENDYQGIEEELKRFVDDLAERAVGLVRERIEENRQISFDPSI